jgi:hypothetical protein
MPLSGDGAPGLATVREPPRGQCARSPVRKSHHLSVKGFSGIAASPPHRSARGPVFRTGTAGGALKGAAVAPPHHAAVDRIEGADESLTHSLIPQYNGKAKPATETRAC